MGIFNKQKKYSKSIKDIEKQHEKFMGICLKVTGVPKKFYKKNKKSSSRNAYEILVENIKI